jgi:hypothetical protein
MCYDASGLNEPRGQKPMGNVSTIVKQMKKEKDKVEKQLSALNLALSAFIGAYTGKGC